MVLEQVVKITRNFQVTIPAIIREKMGLKEGDFVKIIYDEHENVIKIIPIKRKRLTIKLGRQVTVEEIECAVEEMLNENTS